MQGVIGMRKILFLIVFVCSLHGRAQNAWRFELFADNLQLPLSLVDKHQTTYLTHPLFLSRSGLEIDQEFQSGTWMHSIGLSGFYSAYWMSYDMVDIRMQGQTNYFVEQRVNTAGIGLSYSAERPLNQLNRRLDSSGTFSLGIKFGIDFYHLQSPQVEPPYYYQYKLKIEGRNYNGIDFRSLLFLRYSHQKGRFRNFGCSLGTGLSFVASETLQMNYQLGLFYRLKLI